MLQVMKSVESEVAGLVQIKERIAYLLVGQSFEVIAKSCRRICSMLGYFVHRLQFTNCEKLGKQLLQCMRMINTVLDSSQFQKYGHKLPFFGALIQKFEQVTNQRIKSPSEQTLKRLQKNSQSPYYQTLVSPPISTEQHNFISSGKVDNFLFQLSNNQHVLQNNQCICCSQVFIHNFIIYNSNPMVRNVIELNAKNKITENVLERLVNGLCNQGGGVILVGGDRSGDFIRVTGIKFSSYQEVDHKEKEIVKSFENIRPRCRFSVERVLVHTNLVRDEHPAQELMRLCFRILVFPQFPKKLSFIQQAKNGFKTSYQFYLFDKNTSLAKIEAQNYYENIQQNYYSRGSFQLINSHDNIICMRPYRDYSKAVKTYIDLGHHNVKQIAVQPQPQENTEKVEKVLPAADDSPKFRYKNTTLLIVTSKKNQRYITTLKQRLKLKKKTNELVKPFQKSFNLNTGRSIWMVSHEIPFIELKNLIRQCQENNIIKAGAFKMMSVTKELHIQTQKLTQHNQKILKEKLLQRYNHLYNKSKQSVAESDSEEEKGNSGCGSNKEVFSLLFDDYSESIFAFMVLQHLQLRARFMKEAGARASGHGY